MPDSGNEIELGVYRVNGRIVFVERDIEEYVVAPCEAGVQRFYGDMSKYSGIRITKVGRLHIDRQEMRRPASPNHRVRVVGLSSGEGSPDA